MDRILRLHSAPLAIGLFVLMICSLGPSTARAYAPIDDLVASVNQLLQSNQIFNEAVASDLIDTLQTAGTMADQGNNATARQLLTAFAQEVSSLSGDMLAPAAASQLTNQAAQAQSGL